jgi:hypothetical protein
MRYPLRPVGRAKAQQVRLPYTEAVLADGLLLEFKSAYHFLEPCRIVSGKLDFQDDGADGKRLPARASEPKVRSLRGFDIQAAIKGNTQIVSGSTLEGLPKIPNLQYGLGRELPSIKQEQPKGLLLFPLLRRVRLPGQKGLDIRIHGPGLALYHHRIHPAFNFEKPRVLRIVRVASYTKFQTILPSFHAGPVQMKIV